MKSLFRESRRSFYKRNIFFGKPDGGFTKEISFSGNPTEALQMEYLFRETRRKPAKRKNAVGIPDESLRRGKIAVGIPDGGLRKDKQLFF
jgi:hypothetical protein